MVSPSTLRDERRVEMHTLYADRHIEDDSILLITRLDGEVKSLAEEITAWAAAAMERLMGTADPGPPPTADTVASRTRGRLKPIAKAASNEGLVQGVSGLDIVHKGSVPRYVDDADLAVYIKGMRQWTESTTTGNFDSKELTMYGPILSFVQFVARCVQMHVLPSDGESFRLIVPGSGPKKNSDYAPADSDDNTRIDIGLVGAQVGESITAKRSGDYYAIRAVLEAKRSRGDVEDAFAQLYDYSRHLFSERHNLRFAWGLTVCGVDVRACHFGPDRAVASKPMDVSTAA
ncbi:hypothetical protein GGI21_006166, partial [Coemansia aciculifera]